MKKQYITFCKHTEGLSIFMQPWFLDIVCGSNNWDVCIAYAKNGDINGVLVYHFVQKWGFKILKMPVLTPYMNLWVLHDTAWKTEKSLAFEKVVLKNLIAQLPATAFSLQMYPSSFRNWLPFWWAGYSIEPMMNYIVEDLTDIQLVWRNFKDTVRNKIRKAQKLNISIETREDFDSFYAIFQQTVQRIGFKTGVTRDILMNLHREIQKRKTGKIFFAINASGTIEAALYVIWNSKTAIYWIAGMNEKATNNGATSLLLWEVLQELNRLGIPRFEATGSMPENIESFISAFGFKQENYWKVTRYANRFFAFLHFLKKN